MAAVDGFALPARVRTKGGDYRLLPLTTQWQPLDLPGATPANVEVDTFDYYVGVLVE